MKNAPNPTRPMSSLESDPARQATGEHPDQRTEGLPDAMTLGTADVSGMTSPVIETKGAAPDQPDPTDEVVVDQQGRPLGPRALRTRRKILEATTELLDERSMREMRVIDIARRIGSSPATFYQYFKDVEDVVVYLASQAKEATPILVELISESDWEGEQGHERGKQIARIVMDHWAQYTPVLRARNNASDEGHPGLQQERMAAMMPLVEAFKEAIERSHARGRAAGKSEPEATGRYLGRVDGASGAIAITSCLERMSMYQNTIDGLGSSREALVETLATFIQNMLRAPR